MQIDITHESIAKGIRSDWATAHRFFQLGDSAMAVHAWGHVLSTIDGIWNIVNYGRDLIDQDAEQDLMDDIQALRSIAYDMRSQSYHI